MEIFNVFKYHKFALTKLKIYTIENQNTDYLFFISCTSYCILFMLLAFLVSGSVFTYKNLSDLAVVFRSFILICGITQSLSMFYYYAINMRHIQVVHFKLHENVNQMAKGVTFLV